MPARPASPRWIWTPRISTGRSRRPWRGLSALTTLDLSGNRLTGEIPAELGSLEELRLSGNRLTGCIPIALEDVATNDLSLLGVLYRRSLAASPTWKSWASAGTSSAGVHPAFCKSD